MIPRCLRVDSELAFVNWFDKFFIELMLLDLTSTEEAENEAQRDNSSTRSFECRTDFLELVGSCNETIIKPTAHPDTMRYVERVLAQPR